MPKEIISEEEITLPQVKKLLTQRAKEGEEDPSFQQAITLEHATQFSKMAPAVAAKLVDRLIKSFEISRVNAVQIVNIAPITIEELKTIVDARSSSLSDEQMEEIVDLVVKNRS